MTSVRRRRSDLRPLASLSESRPTNGPASNRTNAPRPASNGVTPMAIDRMWRIGMASSATSAADAPAATTRSRARGPHSPIVAKSPLTSRIETASSAARVTPLRVDDAPDRTVDIVGAHALKQPERTRTFDGDLSKRREVDHPDPFADRTRLISHTLEPGWTRPPVLGLISAGAAPLSPRLVI